MLCLERRRGAEKQQLLEQQRLENLRLENELLRQRLEKERSVSQGSQSATGADLLADPALGEWHTLNKWFGSDRPRTEFAMLYAKQLRAEEPELSSRAFLDAVSLKVSEVFGATK